MPEYFFGSNLDHLFDSNDFDVPIEATPEELRKAFIELPKDLQSSKLLNDDSLDTVDYKNLTAKATQFLNTRRAMNWEQKVQRQFTYEFYWHWDDTEDFDFNFFAWLWEWVLGGVVERPFERQKQKQIYDLALGFLVHTRHKVHKAMKQRDLVRNKKFYKMGYLFNRLRRLQTEQKKLLAMIMRMEDKYYLRDIHVFLVSKREFLRLERDMRDTLYYLRMLHEEPNVPPSPPPKPFDPESESLFKK